MPWGDRRSAGEDAAFGKVAETEFPFGSFRTVGKSARRDSVTTEVSGVERTRSLFNAP